MLPRLNETFLFFLIALSHQEKKVKGGKGTVMGNRREGMECVENALRWYENVIERDVNYLNDSVQDLCLSLIVSFLPFHLFLIIFF